MKSVIHKQGKEFAVVYAGFGSYEHVKGPLCEGAKGLYRGRSFLVHRQWKYVTCKHCLKKSDKTKV